jgi:hypothetical protein
MGRGLVVDAGLTVGVELDHGEPSDGLVGAAAFSNRRREGIRQRRLRVATARDL